MNQYPCCLSKTTFIYHNINSHSLFVSIICNDSSHSYINTHFAIVTLQTGLKKAQMSWETLNAPLMSCSKHCMKFCFTEKSWDVEVVFRYSVSVNDVCKCNTYEWSSASCLLLRTLTKLWVIYVRLQINLNHKEILTRPAIFAFIRWSGETPQE